MSAPDPLDPGLLATPVVAQAVCDWMEQTCGDLGEPNSAIAGTLLGVAMFMHAHRPADTSAEEVASSMARYARAACERIAEQLAASRNVQ